MKRILVTVMCLLGMATLFAQKPTNLDQMVVNGVMSASSSTDAHKKGVLMIKLTVDASFQDVDANNKSIEKECPAVRIAPNTLLASRACIDLSGKGTLVQYKGASAIDVTNGLNVSRWIENIKIEGVTLGKDKFRQNDLLLAISVDGTKDKIKKAVQKMPITDLFVAKNPESLKDTFPKMTLNRDDMTWGRECAEVDIVDICTDAQCFKVCWKFIDGKTGDPVFGRNPDTNNLEYLLGFNRCNADKNGRNPNRWYHFLSQSSLDFLQNNVSANDWAYINAHKKDENLYK